MDKVSVVIPAYNAERFIRDTVEHVLRQTYGNMEVIVVDDGSSDGTGKILEEYAGRSGLIYIRQDNAGIAGARNTGLKRCTGEYIALLDHDDLWVADKVEKQVGYLKASGKDAVFSDYWIIRADGTVTTPPNPKRPDVDVLDELLRRNYIYTSTLMFKRGVVEDVGLLDRRFTYCEDWDWFLSMAFKKDIGYLPEYLAYRRDLPTSFSNVYTHKALFYVLLYQKHMVMCSERQRKMFRKAVGKNCYRDAVLMMGAGCFGLGIESFLYAVKKHEVLMLKFPSLMKQYLKHCIGAREGAH